MKRRIAGIAVLGLVALGATLYAALGTRALAQVPTLSTPLDVYAAKFLCGTFQPTADMAEGPVKPGNYQTAINVHNPNQGTIGFVKKAVVLFRSDQPGPKFEVPQGPGKLVGAQLAADFGFEIDCNDIRQVLRPDVADVAFIKGFVVLEVPGAAGNAPRPLDVVVAYTAHGCAPAAIGACPPEGFALDVDRVPATRSR